MPDAQAIYDMYKQETIIVVGSLAETGRLYYEISNPSSEPVTPLQLALAANLGTRKFAIDAFTDWLRGTQIFGVNYNPADIFYWEQRSGRWLATSQLEFGMVWRDIFTPFNSREILETMLSVDEKFRCTPKYELFTDLIAHLWPELLSQPINPHEEPYKPTRTIQFARKIRRKIRRQFNI